MSWSSGLNLLLKVHTAVHLKGGKTWCTLASQRKDHAAELEHCAVHLAYVGRGLFVELVESDIPLKVIENTPKSQSLITGKVKELSAQESKDFNSVLHTGLGVGIVWPKIMSASAGSVQDLPRVGSELELSTQNINIMKAY